MQLDASGMQRRAAASSSAVDPGASDPGNVLALCQSFAELLGIDEAIPEDVLRAIADDPAYARRLFACRGSSEMLKMMLAHPPSIEAEATASPGRMIVNAAAALARWSGAGFARVSPERVEHRLAACRACPHLALPRGALQRLAGTAASDGRICALCGCVVSRKVSMATEQCPARDPEDATLTRWGEPAPSDPG